MSRRHDISWSTSQIHSIRDGTEGGIGVPTMNKHNNLLSLLAVIDHYGFDFIDVKWEQGLPVLGLGGTSEVRELFITNKIAFAYKRHRALPAVESTDVTIEARELIDEDCPDLVEKVFNEMVSEVTILGHPVIRHHQNIVGLVGIYWELLNRSIPWPVLVFDKAQHGNMWSFATSPRGLRMSFKDRLNICLDIAQAITALHELDMVHGDIKPQNFLIFHGARWEKASHHSEIIYAKLADFGYAGWNIDPSKEVSIYLPESRPWVAPEYHHRAFNIQQAKQLEIFSFGLSCLWFLFHDKLKGLILEAPDRLRHMCTESTFYDARSIERLKYNWLLPQLACELIKLETSLDDENKRQLMLFFRSSLDTDSATRKLLLQCLVTVNGYEMPYIFRSPDIEQHIFDYSNLSFKIADNFNPLMSGPYQIREHIASCFEQEALNGRTIKSKQNAAFQYSVCCKMGIGRASSDDETKNWLAISERSYEDLQYQIDVIREGANNEPILYKNSGLGPGFQSGVDHNKGLSLELPEMRDHLQREISDLSKALSPCCGLLGSLNEKLARIMLQAGDTDEAERLLLAYIETAATPTLDTQNDASGTGKPLLAAKNQRPGQALAAQQKIVIPDPDISGCSSEFRRALDLAKNLKEDNMSITVLLASVYEAQGMWREAEILLIQTRNILLTNLTKKVNLLTAVSAALAKLYTDTGRLVEAESIYSCLADWSEKDHGLGHPMTLLLKGNLYASSLRSGIMIEETFLDEMQAHAAQISGQMGRSVRRTLAMRSFLYIQQQRYREAENTLRGILSMSDEHDFDDEERAGVMNLLGAVLDGQNRHEEAEMFYRASVRHGGYLREGSELTSCTRERNLAANLREKRNLTESASLLEQLLIKQSFKLQSTSRTVLLTKDELALTYHEQGRFNEEERLFLPVVETAEQVHGPQSLELAHWKISLARVYQRQKRLCDADDQHLEVFAILSQNTTDNEFELLSCQLYIARNHYLQRRAKHAVDFLIDKIDAFRHRFGPTNEKTCQAMTILASGLADSKRWEEAEMMSLMLLEAILVEGGDRLSRNQIGAIAMRAEILLARGKWGCALLFIKDHVPSLIRWYWINLYWVEIRAVLRFVLSPDNFPNNAYVLGFLVSSVGGLLLGLYGTFASLFWMVSSIRVL